MRTSEYELVWDLVFELEFLVNMVLGALVESPLGYSVIMLLHLALDY